MPCHQCGADNPSTNRFCGACGTALFRQPETWQAPTRLSEPAEHDLKHTDFVSREIQGERAQEFATDLGILNTSVSEASGTDAEFAPSEPVVVAEREHYTPISGPSLLGLSDTPEYQDTEESGYLLEEETPRRHVGWYLFSFAFIVVLAVFAVLEYRAIKTGRVNIPWLTASNSEKPKPTDQAPAVSATPGDSGAAGEKPPQALTSDEAVPAGPQKSASGSATTSDRQTASAPAPGQPKMEVVEKKKPEPPSASSPAKDGANDQASTRDAESRLAQQADAKRKQEMAAAIDREEQPTPDADSGGRPKAVGAPTRASRTSATPDPRQNRLLLTGERFLYGRSGRRDCNQAVAYFREAAKQYNSPAMAHLGAMYASGNCVKQDRLQAYKWFSRAQEVEPNNQWLARNMNMLWRQMTTGERAISSR